MVALTAVSLRSRDYLADAHALRQQLLLPTGPADADLPRAAHDPTDIRMLFSTLGRRAADAPAAPQPERHGCTSFLREAVPKLDTLLAQFTSELLSSPMTERALSECGSDDGYSADGEVSAMDRVMALDMNPLLAPRPHPLEVPLMRWQRRCSETEHAAALRAALSQKRCTRAADEQLRREVAVARQQLFQPDWVPLGVEAEPRDSIVGPRARAASNPPQRAHALISRAPPAAPATGCARGPHDGRAQGGGADARAAVRVGGAVPRGGGALLAHRPATRLEPPRCAPFSSCVTARGRRRPAVRQRVRLAARHEPAEHAAPAQVREPSIA